MPVGDSPLPLPLPPFINEVPNQVFLCIKLCNVIFFFPLSFVTFLFKSNFPSQPAQLAFLECLEMNINANARYGSYGMGANMKMVKLLARNG